MTYKYLVSFPSKADNHPERDNKIISPNKVRIVDIIITYSLIPRRHSILLN